MKNHGKFDSSLMTGLTVVLDAALELEWARAWLHEKAVLLFVTDVVDVGTRILAVFHARSLLFHEQV